MKRRSFIKVITGLMTATLQTHLAQARPSSPLPEDLANISLPVTDSLIIAPLQISIIGIGNFGVSVAQQLSLITQGMDLPLTALKYVGIDIVPDCLKHDNQPASFRNFAVEQFRDIADVVDRSVDPTSHLNLVVVGLGEITGDAIAKAVVKASRGNGIFTLALAAVPAMGPARIQTTRELQRLAGVSHAVFVFNMDESQACR